MSAVRVQVGQAASVAYPLSFNEIIGFVAGRTPARQDAQPGMFQKENGDILVVFSKNPQLVSCEQRHNRKRTTKTGFTRTGMAMIDKSTGGLRLVTCDRGEDGKKQWRKYEGSITLQGNPHVVDSSEEDEE